MGLLRLHDDELRPESFGFEFLFHSKVDLVNEIVVVAVPAKHYVGIGDIVSIGIAIDKR